MSKVKCQCAECGNAEQGRGERKPIPFRFVFGTIVVFGVVYAGFHIFGGM